MSHVVSNTMSKLVRGMPIHQVLKLYLFKRILRKGLMSTDGLRASGIQNTTQKIRNTNYSDKYLRSSRPGRNSHSTSIRLFTSCVDVRSELLHLRVAGGTGTLGNLRKRTSMLDPSSSFVPTSTAALVGRARMIVRLSTSPDDSLHSFVIFSSHCLMQALLRSRGTLAMI